MKSIITQAERDQLSELIAKIEQQTAGELVTVVYSKSSAYVAYRMAAAFALALAAVGFIHLALPWLPVFELLGLELLVAAAAYGLLGQPMALRLVVPRKVREQAVRDRARLLFLELGITETRDRSGVLIYLSELERRVEVLGDRGIYEQLGEDAWPKLVSELTCAIRGGHAVQGLRQLLERLGNELIARFPVRADDRNELPNAVLTDRN